MAYGFSTALGWGVFWISLIASIVLFSVYRKMYIIFYLISVALYVYTIGFMIDAFQLGKTAILLSLLISSILFMILGYYFSVIIQESKK